MAVWASGARRSVDAEVASPAGDEGAARAMFRITWLVPSRNQHIVPVGVVGAGPRAMS
jgi:hypothetical protein